MSTYWAIKRKDGLLMGECKKFGPSLFTDDSIDRYLEEGERPVRVTITEVE